MEDLKPIRRYRYRWRVTLSCGHSRIWHLNERPVDVQGLCAECQVRLSKTTCAPSPGRKTYGT